MKKPYLCWAKFVFGANWHCYNLPYICKRQRIWAGWAFHRFC